MLFLCHSIVIENIFCFIQIGFYICTSLTNRAGFNKNFSPSLGFSDCPPRNSLRVFLCKMYNSKPTKWKFIKGSKKLYRVSEYGDIQNTKTEKQLKPSLQYYTGFLQINLKINDEYKNYQIHKLVATAFIKNPENKKHLIHLDYNKQNNHYSNLKWATIGELNEHKKNFDSFNGVVKEEVIYSNIYKTTFGKTFVSGEYTSKENAKLDGLLCDGINYKYVKTIELKTSL